MNTAILAALMALVPWWGDRNETSEARNARMIPIAEAITTATSDATEQAALITLAWAESKLASYVTEDRCHEGPVGQRCDQGRARGPWQVHHGARKECSIAWELSATSVDGLTHQAWCALSRYRFSKHYCSSHGSAGALSGYRGAYPSCNRNGASLLASIAGNVEARIRSGEQVMSR
jgi:hypothetical protein